MFQRLRRISALVLLFLAVASKCSLADEQIGAFLVVDDVHDAIALVGEITINSPLDFRRALQRRPNATIVITASPGGVVASALIIAQDLNERRLGTYIPAEMGCYSACAYVFLAGSSRFADGELGVHQMASDVQDNAGIQVTVSDVLDTLLEFETPREVISRMLRTPNEDMYVFSSVELEGLGINRPSETTGDADNETDSAGSVLPTPDSDERRLAIYEGLDFYGEDLSSGRTENLVECTRACLGDQACRAFTFNANPKLATGPNCFLKSGVGRLEGYQQAISGLLLLNSNDSVPIFSFGAIDPTEDVESGVRLSGTNLSKLPPAGISLGRCRQTCADNHECSAFTYRTSTKQCLLKGEVGRSSRVRGYTSGTKRVVTFEAAEVIRFSE